jgi:hypothetical protein
MKIENINLAEYIPSKIYPESHIVDDMEILRVVVEGEEYQLCEDSSHNMGANKKTGVWGRGFRNTSGDPRKVERTGRLGEMAFGKLTETPIDLSYKRMGDKEDTVYEGKSVNVKTAFALYGEIYVRYSMNNRVLTLHEDVFVFAYLRNEDRNKKIATVDFLGCLLKSEIVTKEKRPRENWINYVCPYADLHSMKELMIIKYGDKN